ncbi:MAG: hypothetical protein GY723_01475 [bacterium]|nr:hypothetical protein [bacterium]MCP5068836.1 hypothetical protein [bacterium]
MDDALRETLKAFVGISDEELNQLRPKVVESLENVGALLSYRIVAEVAESQNCSARYKVGDKMVFNGTFLNTEESTTEHYCMDAIPPIHIAMRAMIAAILNLDDPNKYFFNHVQCLDTGSRHGGFGRVLFNVYAEKIEQPEGTA